MSTYQFLSHLYSLDVKLTVDGDRLLCKAPQGVLTQQLQTQIAEYKTELLNFLRHDRGSTITRIAPEKEDIPLSFAQERLWFLNQLEGASATYNMPAALRLTGDLNLDAFHQALAEIVSRHEVLRTSFTTVNGIPIQVIDPLASMNVEVTNLQHFTDTEREVVIEQQIQQLALMPFDLEIAPLIRCSLLQLSETDYVFCINMHHIVSDGWSIGVLVQELSALYTAYCAANPSPLKELEIQYADFALWQRQWLSGAILEQQLQYWVSQLQGAPELLQLPTDRPRPSVQTYRGATQSFTLSPELTQRLQALSRQTGSTLYMTLMAAFATLLYRYSGQSDVVIGSPIANRNRSEIELLIGFFVNTLVLRTQLEDRLSFEQLLKQVRETTLTAYEHQDLPFEQIVEALRPQRSMSHSPLFQVMFALQNTPLGDIELPSVKLSELHADSTIAKFDLTLSMSETEQGLGCEWEYKTDLFDKSTIERMASHFENLLSAIVENPQQAVGELPLLSATERQQLLVEWNDTEWEYPKDRCIHQLFEEQVAKIPDAVAVVFEQQELTYQQLNERANQLAHHLQTLGVKPEVLVGICVERSLEMLVGLLGILKAGGAYVPLDPSYPAERLSYMVSDSGVDVLLTQHALLSELPTHSAQVVCLDSDWLAISQFSPDNLDAGVGSANLAYVIYTSGSTGSPKGVQIEHHGVAALCHWTKPLFTTSQLSGVLAATSICFDLSVFEIFTTLCLGGKVILVHNVLCITNLEIEIAEQITLINAVPSVIPELLRTGGIPEQVQIINLAGEPLQSRIVEQLYHHQNIEGVFNLYGPSEDTTYSTFALVGKGTIEPPSIGRPIANTQIYILDKHLQPVPIGVPGELHIGGDGLARGYLNRPKLTAEKFISNPFSNDESARLYKTGDLARYFPDGNIEFLGRIDNQVKIRGFRIELGEIEAVLTTHPQVQQAVVIANDELSGNKRLIAYVVTADESMGTSQLREYLHQKIPDYMVPGAFVTLDALPLTPNGKVDRKSLPAPDGEIDRVREYVAPRTPNEEIIAHIFTTVLGVETVGIHDNFFELGGHSLVATQLISRLKQSFAVDIPLRVIFESPTVTQLDQIIGQLRAQEQGLSLPEIERIAPETEDIPLSFAQERLWFLNQLEGASATYNMPAALRLTGDLNLDAFHQALAEIVSRHEVLRTSFTTVNGTPMQVIHPSASMTIETIDLQHLPDSEREVVIEQQIQQLALMPFDLEIAPLIRCSLLQLSETDYVFCINMHHIVSDGWSIGVLVQELSALYTAYCAANPSPLKELEIQYADFALWQRQWLSGAILEQQLQYWVSQLQGAPELLQLPTDRPRPSVQTYRGATQSFSLSPELTQRLQALSRQTGSTLYMTLMAAFATLLYRYSGQSDVVIGSPIANRNRSEIELLIGFFVNTLVLRTQLEDRLSFEQLLKQVRETTLTAYEHQDLPFEQIVEALRPQRSMSHSPLFQVMFALQNTPLGDIELPSVKLSELHADSTIAKFDLTLSMSETEQGLVGSWEYNTDLFDDSTIERMTAHFENLLSAIVENPTAIVGELPLLNAAERHQLLVEWNDTASEYPADKCIHQLFESQAEKTPDAVAVVFENQQLTYLELNQRANQLAYHLQTLGIEPEGLVGICMERSLEMLVGLLGILKAGGAYVPLDPNYPTERLAYMLNDAQVPVLLTQTQLLDSLPDHKQIICLDTDWLLISSQSESNPISGVRSSNLAYVIYTSGSTGMPKGTTILHQGVVNYLSWATKAYMVSEGNGAPVQSSIAFDATITSLFSPLLVGQKVVILPQQQEIEALIAVLISESDFSLVKLTPAHLQLLAQLLPQQIVAQPTKALVIGGEALLGKNLSFWHNYAPNTRLFNEYGPTETVVGCCVYEVTHTTSLSESILIGRPIANTQLYILDRQMQPVPIGVTGELHIGGDGLARGYLNRPELTQAKFIPNPFSSDKSARLYKTGDLARYLNDGNIEYLGRIDNQVKIRGFRIELGEIEAVLSSHPQIQQAVAIATTDPAGTQRLVAYVVSEEETLSTQQLREFLQQQLPAYMVPSAFVILDTLPLTPNGKVDRKAMPAPDGEIDQSRQHVAPRTEIEQILTNIWQELLLVERVSIHDNFFELGGHSLLAVQLVSQIEKQFSLHLPLATLFQSSTIEQLAIFISADPATGKLWSPLVPIQPKGSLPPFFCVAGGGGNVMYFHELAQCLGKDRPFYGLQAQGLDGETPPLESVEEIASQYIKAIETVQQVGPYFLGGHSFGGKVAFEMAQQLQRKGQVAYLTILDTTAPVSQLDRLDDPSNRDHAESICDAAVIVEELIGENLSISYEHIAALTLDEQVSYFKQRLEMVGFLPPQTDIKLVRGFLQVFRVQGQINYAPLDTSTVPITLFRAQENDSQQENSSDLFQDPAWGWNQFSDREVEIYTVPGSHISMMTKPHVQVLAQHLQKSLDKAQKHQLETSNAQTTEK